LHGVRLPIRGTTGNTYDRPPSVAGRLQTSVYVVLWEELNSELCGAQSGTKRDTIQLRRPGALPPPPIEILESREFSARVMISGYNSPDL